MTQVLITPCSHALNTIHTFTETLMIAFTFFHMLGMSSACTNPFLYGFLNDNFLKEFKTFFLRNSQTPQGIPSPMLSNTGLSSMQMQTRNGR